MWTVPSFSVHCRGKLILLGGLLCATVAAGCVNSGQAHKTTRPNPYLTPDTRHSIPLSSSAGKEHRAVMLQHLETIQVIVNALVEEDYELAQGLTEMHLGFFQHRQAMAHHQAAEELARIIPTKDLKQILPSLNNVLKACVSCHLEYKVRDN